jgi:uncharacterized protein YjbJ (UPF0337 family)
MKAGRDEGKAKRRPQTLDRNTETGARRMDRNELRELATRLEQQRDELRVKVALAKAEAGDEWDELEDKWDRLKGKLRAAGDEADEASDDVKAALSMLMEELKKGYERIRDRL